MGPYEGDVVPSTESRNWCKQYVAEAEENATFPSLMENPGSFKMLSTPVPSLEMLIPSPGSHLRKSTKVAATFNLIATIVGGGVLSMPLALAKAGLALGTLLIIFAAIITDFSLYLLCACARKTGATSYGAVARHAFGPGLEVSTSFVILTYLLLVLCGFMVLIKGIWAPIVLSVISKYLADFTEIEHADDVVLLVAIIITLPLFLSQDLHGLRHSCYASFASIVVLCIAMMYRAYEKNTQDPHLFTQQVLYVTPNLSDGLFAYPIIALAFVSSFNVVEVHCSLVDPTRRRIRQVIHSSVTWSMALMFVFAVAGYMNGYVNTNGNILLNFDPKDEIILLGRIGCGICTLLAMPMSLLPCRNALLVLPGQFFEWLMPSHSQSNDITETSDLSCLDEESALQDSDAMPLMYQSTLTDGSEEQKEMQPSHILDIDQCAKSEKIVRYVTTFSILSLCYVGAVLAPGVAIVWSIVGSSLAFLVQYILPAVCYIKLCSNRKGPMRRDVKSAWMLLLVSCVGAIACTAQTIWRLFFMDRDV